MPEKFRHSPVRAPEDNPSRTSSEAAARPNVTNSGAGLSWSVNHCRFVNGMPSKFQTTGTSLGRFQAIIVITGGDATY